MRGIRKRVTLIMTTFARLRFDRVQYPSRESTSGLASSIWDATELMVISDRLAGNQDGVRSVEAIDELVRPARDPLPNRNRTAESRERALLWFLCTLVELAMQMELYFERNSQTAGPPLTHTPEPGNLARRSVPG